MWTKFEFDQDSLIGIMIEHGAAHCNAQAAVALFNAQAEVGHLRKQVEEYLEKSISDVPACTGG